MRRFTNDAAAAATMTSATLPATVATAATTAANAGRACVALDNCTHGMYITPPPPQRVSPCRSVRYVLLVVYIVKDILSTICGFFNSVKINNSPKFTFAAVLTVMVLMLVFPMTAGAQSAGNVIDMSDNDPPSSGTGWTYSGNRYDIQDGANVVVRNNNGASNRQISNNNGTANITLQNATIVSSGIPLNVGGTGTLTLTLIGTNTITASSMGGNNEGIYVPSGGTLTIQGDGILNVTGNADATGIGNTPSNNAGTINIRGGRITAAGGANNAMGIGGQSANINIDFSSASASSFVRAVGGGAAGRAFSHAPVQTGVGSHRIGSGPQTDGTYAFNPSDREVTIFKNIAVPPTGLPNMTTSIIAMFALIALSLALWGYVGYTYIPRRKDNRGR